MSKAMISVLGLWYSDKTILNDMVLPSQVNRDILVPELLSQCAELEILYPDAGFLRKIVEAWSKASLFKWQKLADTMDLEYDPISNYDRHEEWTNSSESNPGSIFTTAQQGYENSGFVDASRVTASGKDEEDSEHKGRMWGNIGVTTSQQMIESERSVANFNIYQVIINDFKERFCLQIY